MKLTDRSMSAMVTSNLRRLEKNPDEKKFLEFLAWAKTFDVDLTPWKKRVEALRVKVLLHEVHNS